MTTVNNAQACCTPKQLASAVEFPTDKRVHISLNVKSVRQSLPFYKILFNQNPVKLREDYAKFEAVEPAVNFTLNEHPETVDRDGHFGIEVKSTDAVKSVQERFVRAGFSVDAAETQVACCFSVQDKVWVVDPDGNHWEIFVVTDNEAAEGCGTTCICYDAKTGGCSWN